ncbi:MAG: hypothetical protein GF364_06275 [Candidatus Lokiarchaeota archaeon]|nr:hypothetical protein [Candidatus Lokiarchaeota archaeon]
MLQDSDFSEKWIHYWKKLEENFSILSSIENVSEASTAGSSDPLNSNYSDSDSIGGVPYSEDNFSTPSHPYQTFINLIEKIQEEIEASQTSYIRDELIEFFEKFIFYNTSKESIYNKIKDKLDLRTIIEGIINIPSLSSRISIEDLLTDQVLDMIYKKLINYEIQTKWISIDYLNEIFPTFSDQNSKLLLEEIILQGERIKLKEEMKDIRIRRRD